MSTHRTTIKTIMTTPNRRGAPLEMVMRQVVMEEEGGKIENRFLTTPQKGTIIPLPPPFPSSLSAKFQKPPKWGISVMRGFTFNNGEINIEHS